jgi:hypothetical protein
MKANDSPDKAGPSFGKPKLDVAYSAWIQRIAALMAEMCMEIGRRGG